LTAQFGRLSFFFAGEFGALSLLLREDYGAECSRSPPSVAMQPQFAGYMIVNMESRLLPEFAAMT
jgi:hypothetical protein